MTAVVTWNRAPYSFVYLDLKMRPAIRAIIQVQLLS